MSNVLRYWYDHAGVTLCSIDEGPLRGLRHRTVIDARTGAAASALWQEEHESGFLVPLHRHDCEELIVVLAGEIRATVGNHEFTVGPLQSILIPEWDPHGFEVTSSAPVRLLAYFSSATPGIFRLDGSPSTPPWEGGASDHLEEE